MKKTAEFFVSIGFFLAFLFIGASRMWGKFGPAEFAARRDEYLLHIGAGVFLGVTLQIAASALFSRKGGSWRNVFLAVSGVVSPFLFLVLIHQTRAFLNDGPGTISLGAGLLAASFFSYLLKRA
jgi:hypothetical protein